MTEPSAEMRRLVGTLIADVLNEDPYYDAEAALLAAIAEVEQRAEKAEGKLQAARVWVNRYDNLRDNDDLETVGYISGSAVNELDGILADAQEGTGNE